MPPSYSPPLLQTEKLDNVNCICYKDLGKNVMKNNLLLLAMLRLFLYPQPISSLHLIHSLLLQKEMKIIIVHISLVDMSGSLDGSFLPQQTRSQFQLADFCE